MSVITAVSFQELKAAGGGTLHDGVIVGYEDGYQVAFNERHGGREIEFTETDFKDQDVREYIEALPSCGFWYDERIKALVFDAVSVHVDSFEVAYRLAKENGQKAVYDWLEETTRRIDGK